jgi:hypothetical protein
MCLWRDVVRSECRQSVMGMHIAWMIFSELSRTFDGQPFCLFYWHGDGTPSNTLRDGPFPT